VICAWVKIIASETSNITNFSLTWLSLLTVNWISRRGVAQWNEIVKFITSPLSYIDCFILFIIIRVTHMRRGLPVE